jgi:hypothetical protein
LVGTPGLPRGAQEDERLVPPLSHSLRRGPLERRTPPSPYA